MAEPLLFDPGPSADAVVPHPTSCAPTPAERLYAALSQVMEASPQLPWDGPNAQRLGYEYTTAEAVMAAIRPLFCRYGLLIWPAVADRVVTRIDTKGGGTASLVDGVVTFRVAHVGGASIDLQVLAGGYDANEKGAAKAMTGALKTALTQLLLLTHQPKGRSAPTPATPRRGAEPPVSAPAAGLDAYRERVKGALLRAVGGDERAARAALSTASGGKRSFTELKSMADLEKVQKSLIEHPELGTRFAEALK